MGLIGGIIMTEGTKIGQTGTAENQAAESAQKNVIYAIFPARTGEGYRCVQRN